MENKLDTRDWPHQSESPAAWNGSGAVRWVSVTTLFLMCLEFDVSDGLFTEYVGKAKLCLHLILHTCILKNNSKA